MTHCYFEESRYYTPLYSDPPLGKYSWRQVTNIVTGEVEPHRYAGKTIGLPAQTRVRSVVEHRLRRSEKGRRRLRRLRRLLGRQS